MRWRERACEARAVLVDQYWDERTSLLRVDPGRHGRWAAVLPWGTWHYWWQAHGLEVLLDGHESNDPGAGQHAERLIRGMTRRNGGNLTANSFYDDVAWMGLATLRAHRLGLAERRIPRSLATAVEVGWAHDLGGVRWRAGDEFRNVAATAPTAMLLAGVGQLEGDPRGLAMARGAADWLHATLVDPTGIVWDGCRPRGGVLVPEGQLWSYNVGTTAGLDVVLAGMASPATSPQLLARAAGVVRAGTAALRAGCAEVGAAMALLADGSPDDLAASGIWRDELGDGVGADPQLFRGILARYATDLVLADPTLVDVARDIAVQAEAAWAARDGRGRIGARWGVDPGWFTYRQPPPTLAAHLSGALILGSAARLEAAGLT